MTPDSPAAKTMWDAYHPPGQRQETVAEEIVRLQREIAERQARLQFLVCGDPRQCVGVPTIPPLPPRRHE
jgi:hypothetical protein